MFDSAHARFALTLPSLALVMGLILCLPAGPLAVRAGLIVEPLGLRRVESPDWQPAGEGLIDVETGVVSLSLAETITRPDETPGAEGWQRLDPPGTSSTLETSSTSGTAQATSVPLLWDLPAWDRPNWDRPGWGRVIVADVTPANLPPEAFSDAWQHLSWLGMDGHTRVPGFIELSSLRAAGGRDSIMPALLTGSGPGLAGRTSGSAASDLPVANAELPGWARWTLDLLSDFGALGSAALLACVALSIKFLASMASR